MPLEILNCKLFCNSLFIVLSVLTFKNMFSVKKKRCEGGPHWPYIYYKSEARNMPCISSHLYWVVSRSIWHQEGESALVISTFGKNAPLSPNGALVHLHSLHKWSSCTKGDFPTVIRKVFVMCFLCCALRKMPVKCCSQGVPVGHHRLCTYSFQGVK